MLSGEIPTSLGSCTSLEQLIMKGNFFQGSLPQSLSSLRGIQYLDLSRNNLSGKLPMYLENYSMLQRLNISFNDFEGEVPIGGVFKNASVISVDGNDKLCGGIAELNLSTCTNNGSKKHTRPVWLKLIIPIVSGILLLTLMLSFAFVCWLRKKRKGPSSESSLLASLLQVSYDNLLKATGGFSSDNLIGMGSFGSVYKGILDHNETVVAVKVLNLQRQGAFKSFMAECEALRSTRHRNLVKILTACSSVDFQGNDFKALVYEFMVHGSLDEWLHPNPGSAHETPRKLNLLERLNIAIDVACALDYLHHHCQIPIVHCDLKPSNVLLDNEMTGHVGDFGLARFLSEATHNFSTNQTSSIGVRGTVGYTAPEYGMGSELSTYGDMYSYGILLLEMFTGKRPTDELFKDSLNLHNFVKEALPNRVAEIVDPILLQEREEEETNANNTRTQSSTRSHKIEECWISIFGVGIACSAELARERMNISDVAVELHSIRNIFLGTGVHGERRGTIRTSQYAGASGQ
uniref:non-specific serine/threonine protein kinase n=1 Tax=Davidia involucrata TaxID=16924 RepID=A0A5B7AAK6_DAVIN